MLFIASIVCILAASSGCAGRRVPPPAVGDTAESQKDRLSPRDAREIRLPGQNRHLPSQDPNNAPINKRTRIGGRTKGPSGGATSTARSVAPPPVPLGQTRYRVQVLATLDHDKAVTHRDRLQDHLGVPVYVDREQGVWKVRVGNERDRVAADALRLRLVQIGYKDAFVRILESR
jgi:hypothetical protein